MFGHYRRDHSIRHHFGELHVAARLPSLIKSRLQEPPPEFGVFDRIHAAISNSNCLTLGNTVATGGVK